MANFKSIVKIGAGAITAIVGGIVALKGAKASKEDSYDATLEEINEAPATETADEPEESEPETVEAEEIEETES